MRFDPYFWKKSEPEEQRSISFQDVWGQAKDAAVSGPVSMEHALTLTAVYSATSLISDLVSSFPLLTYRTMKGKKKKMEPAAELVSDPTQFGTTVDWVHRAVLSMALRGNAFGYVTEITDLGYPRQIEWLHPDEVSLRSDRSVARPQWFWLGKPVDNSRFFHIPMMTVPGRILGLSPVRAFSLTLDQGLLAQTFGRDYFKNGIVPSGILKSSTAKIPSEEDANTVRARFKRAANGRDVAVLGMDLDYKPITIAPNESQFLATLRLSATQIASIYHLPPEMVGGETGSSNTYANVEMRALDIARYALMPYIKKIEEAITQFGLPRGQSAKFNLDDFQRSDMQTRYNSYQIGLKNRFLKVDEVRTNEDLEEFGGKDGGLLEEQQPNSLGSNGNGQPNNEKQNGNAPENDTQPQGAAQPKQPPAPEKNTGAGKGSVSSNSLDSHLTAAQLAIAMRADDGGKDTQ